MINKKNRLLIIGAVLALSASLEAAKPEVLKPYTEENNTLMEMVENETNDNTFVQFVDGDVIDEPGKSVDKVKKNNFGISSKKSKDKNKEYAGNYMLFDKDEYGIIASNIDVLDENYIISDKVFDFMNVDDSWEPFNRRMYAFNVQLDRKVLYPVSRVYKAVVPQPIRKGIANFYNNFKEIPTIVNSLLQLNPKKALNALGRFTVNSTVGLLGTADVASKIGLKQDWETFGDTLGRYGVGAGSYIVLPMLGPSTVRDTLGSIPDTVMESAARRVAERELFFETGVFDKNVYGFTRPIVTGLNARSLVDFRYGDLNSPFEYDLVKAVFYNYRKLKVVK